jgi:hypothetical protein
LRVKDPSTLDAPSIPFPTRRAFGFSVALSFARCGNCHVLFGASSFDGLSNLNKLAECAAESGLAALVRPLPGLSRKT